MRTRTSAMLLGVACTATAALAQPANDDCANATVIGALPYTDTVDTTTATTEPDDPSCEGTQFPDLPEPEPNSVWYRYTPAQDVLLRVDTSASPFYATATVALGSCGSLGVLDCDLGFNNNQQVVEAPVRAGTTAYVEIVDAGHLGGGLATVAVSETPIAPGTPLHTGLDFQVNVETPDVHGYQRDPDVGAAADGSFVVAWTDEDADVDGYGIAVRLFDPTATPTTGEIVVNQHTTALQEFPAVAVGPGGAFVVVWQSEFQVDFDSTEIVARRYDAAGLPLGDEFVVNTYTTGYQIFPDVAMAAGGAFVVSWVSEEQAAGEPGVFAQRFDAAGVPAGGEFQVNTAAVGPFYYPAYGPALAMDATQRFLVVWENENFDVVTRAFDGAGTGVTGEVVVSTDGGTQADVAMGPSGRALVAWWDGGGSVTARFVEVDGDLVGLPFEVSDPTLAQSPEAPAVGTNAEGDFVVTWEDQTYEATDPNYLGVRGRRLTAAGQAVGSEMQVNTYAPYGGQRHPRIAMADADSFIVTWWDDSEFGRDGFGRSIFGHRFELPPLPSGCPAAPRSGCKQPTAAGKGRILLVDKEGGAKDGLKWKWWGEATTFADLGDPLGTDAVSLCLYDGSGERVSAATVAGGGECAGEPCWKALGDKGFRFVDETVAQSGILKLLLKVGDAGRSKVVVRGRGAALDMPALPPVLPLTAQLGIAGGTCWEARFAAGGVQKSSPVVFGAQANGPG